MVLHLSSILFKVILLATRKWIASTIEAETIEATFISSSCPVCYTVNRKEKKTAKDDIIGLNFLATYLITIV